jgi:para-nitrobenzyl esterase
LTKGLIHRAIIQSGAPIQAVRPYLTLKEMEQIGVITAGLLRAPATKQIKYLRGLPAADFIGLMPAVRTKLLEEYGGQAYDEGTDGFAITQPPNEVWISHQELPVPLMIGNTSLDTPAAIAGEAPLDPKATPEEVLAWQQRILEVFFAKEPDLLARALKNYGLRGEPNEVSTYAPYGTPLQQLTTDLNHRCGVGASAALHSAIAPTWQFEFTRTTPGHLASHSSELRYIFGYDDLEDAATRRQSDIMQQYWTNFAKTGNPNGTGLPVWAKYDTTTKPSLEFADGGPVARAAVRALLCSTYAEKYTRDPKRLSTGADLRVRGTGGAR